MIKTVIVTYAELLRSEKGETVRHLLKIKSGTTILDVSYCEEGVVVKIDEPDEPDGDRGNPNVKI